MTSGKPDDADEPPETLSAHGAIGEVETGLRSPAPTASADYAALRALSSGGRPELEFEAERVAEERELGSNTLWALRRFRWI